MYKRILIGCLVLAASAASAQSREVVRFENLNGDTHEIGTGTSQGGGSIMVSCAGLTSGTSYTLVNGNPQSTVKTTLTGSNSGGCP